MLLSRKNWSTINNRDNCHPKGPPRGAIESQKEYVASVIGNQLTKGSCYGQIEKALDRSVLQRFFRIRNIFHSIHFVPQKFTSCGWVLPNWWNNFLQVPFLWAFLTKMSAFTSMSCVAQVSALPIAPLERKESVTGDCFVHLCFSVHFQAHPPLRMTTATRFSL